MYRSTLLRGASAGALALVLFSSTAFAQETLPAIDIGVGVAPPDSAAIFPGLGGPRAPDGGGRFTGYETLSAPSVLKTDTPIMETPISVQTVTRQTMDDQQAITVQDAITVNSSGVAINSFTLPYDRFTIRGFSTENNVYFNGLRQNNLMDIETVNLQSIEILKGPAAMLYGRSEPGGLVDLTPKRPLDQPYFSAQEQAGSYGFTKTSVDATGPLTTDKTWLYRVNASYLHSDSFRDFVTDEYYFVAPTVSFRPNDQFRANVDLQFMHKIFVDDTYGLVAIGNKPASIPISRYLEDPTVTGKLPDRFDYRYYGYDWTYDINKNWSVTNRLYYSSIGIDETTTSSTGVNQVTGALTRDIFHGEYGQATVATNLDLKGNFDTGPLSHSTLTGFDYYHMDSPVAPFILDFFTAKALPSFNIYNPGYGSNLAGIKPNIYFVNSESWKGVYAQDMISFWDNKLHLLLGGRYDWAMVSDQQNFNNPLLANWTELYQWSKAFSPRIGLTYQPVPWLSLYGNYTKSLSDNNGLNNGQALPPITSYQYEGGVKAELLDKRLLLTLDYFDIVKTNIPGPDPTNPTNTLIAGKAESKGVEFDLKGRINDNWSVIANYTHDDARVVQGSLYNPLTEITSEYFIAGKRLVSVPKDMGNLWLKYDADGQFKGLSAGGGVSVVGSSFGDNANSFVLPSYATLNGMLAYRFAVGPTHVTAQINVKNLLDTTYYAASQTRFQITPGTPRTILGSLRVEF